MSWFRLSVLSRSGLMFDFAFVGKFDLLNPAKVVNSIEIKALMLKAICSRSTVSFGLSRLMLIVLQKRSSLRLTC